MSSTSGGPKIIRTIHTYGKWGNEGGRDQGRKWGAREREEMWEGGNEGGREGVAEGEHEDVAASSAVSIPAIWYSIPNLEGSHHPNMMPVVVPRFETFSPSTWLHLDCQYGSYLHSTWIFRSWLWQRAVHLSNEIETCNKAKRWWIKGGCITGGGWSCICHIFYKRRRRVTSGGKSWWVGCVLSKYISMDSVHVLWFVPLEARV